MTQGEKNPFLFLFILLPPPPLSWPLVPRYHIFAVIQLCSGLRRFLLLTREAQTPPVILFIRENIQAPNYTARTQLLKPLPSKIRDSFITKQIVQIEPRNPISIDRAPGFFLLQYLAWLVGITIYMFYDLREEFTVKLLCTVFPYKQLHDHLPKTTKIYTTWILIKLYFPPPFF